MQTSLFLHIFANEINEMGVTFDDTEKKFVFDFEHDGAEDIVSLTGDGYQVEAFGKCFYYYNDSLLPITESEDKGLFIRKAVDKLDKQINLYYYDLVLFPKLRSRECQYMLRYIYRFNWLEYMQT